MPGYKGSLNQKINKMKKNIFTCKTCIYKIKSKYYPEAIICKKILQENGNSFTIVSEFTEEIEVTDNFGCIFYEPKNK